MLVQNGAREAFSERVVDSCASGWETEQNVCVTFMRRKLSCTLAKIVCRMRDGKLLWLKWIPESSRWVVTNPAFPAVHHSVGLGTSWTISFSPAYLFSSLPPALEQKLPKSVFRKRCFTHLSSLLHFSILSGNQGKRSELKLGKNREWWFTLRCVPVCAFGSIQFSAILHKLNGKTLDG